MNLHDSFAGSPTSSASLTRSPSTALSYGSRTPQENSVTELDATSGSLVQTLPSQN